MVLVSFAVSQGAYAQSQTTMNPQGESRLESHLEKVKQPPQLAGFALVTPKHSCSLNFISCMSGCKHMSGPNCAISCESDCDVCAIDYAKDTGEICK